MEVREKAADQGAAAAVTWGADRVAVARAPVAAVRVPEASAYVPHAGPPHRTGRVSPACSRNARNAGQRCRESDFLFAVLHDGYPLNISKP